MKKSLEIKKTFADIDRKIRGLACNGLRLIGQGWQVTAMRENFLLENKKKKIPGSTRKSSQEKVSRRATAALEVQL